MARTPEQGEIWSVNFDPVEGHEQRGSRPSLLLSPAEFNSLPSDLVIVVPVTTRARGWEFKVPIKAPEGGLTKDSVALAHQIRTVSHSRLIDRRGQVKSATLDEVLAISQRLISRPRSPG
jgi:mRNA interferase MazF